MSFTDHIKTQLNRRGLRSLLAPLVSELARRRGQGVQKIFHDHGIWIHKTSRGYFAYPHPYVRLNMAQLDDFAQSVFLLGYRPKPGDVIMDIGAGVGEETLTFSRAVGAHGKVISIEAHPLSFRCLQKLVEYNRLENVLPVHRAVTQPLCNVTTIEDSKKYIRNRVDCGSGIRVSGVTVDALCRNLGLGRIHFLKMNIEGAERLAIRGMVKTLRQTEVLCICCHDFLAGTTGDDRLRTKDAVRKFLRQAGLRVVERQHRDLSPYLRDQLWAYNDGQMQKTAL